MGKGTHGVAAVDHERGPAGQQSGHKMRKDSRSAGRRRGNKVIEPRADKVEGPDNGVIELAAQSVGMDYALEQLLRCGVNPALFVRRSVYEGTRILFVRRHTRERLAIDFSSG